jgi:hypothetical protein
LPFTTIFSKGHLFIKLGSGLKINDEKHIKDVGLKGAFGC